MLSREKKEDSKLPGSEDYDVNHPQNLTQPVFNSTSTDIGTDHLPGIENLNHNGGLKDSLKESKDNVNDPSDQVNEEPLFGDAPKTDLGNSSSDDDDEEDEGLIRT
jgi:hypothetical protein